MLEVRLKNGSPTEPVEIVCTIHIYFLMTAIQRSNVVSQSVCHVMIRSNIKQWVSFLCSANQSASQTVLTGILLQGNTGYFTECFLQPSQLQQIRGQTWPSLSHRNEEYSLGETEIETERDSSLVEAGPATICHKAETSVNIGLCLQTIPDNTMINSHIPTVKIRSAWEKHRG